MELHRVFLGSTYEDLHEHRAAVREAIDRRDDCKAVVMETFGARAGRPKEVCLGIVRGCQAYVGLIGHCYGHVPDGEAISITEAEYEAAVELGLPRLLFVASERFAPPIHVREDDGRHAKQQAFRRRLLAAETVQLFDGDRGMLAARVGEALTRELGKLGRHEVERSGPVLLPRGDLCLAREDELAQLRDTVLAGEPGPAVVLGPAGIGKSTLTLAALHDPRVEERFGTRRWFVPLETATEPAAILAQVGLGMGLRPGPDLEARLTAELATGPALLVLDNAETPWWKDAPGTEAVLERLARPPELALVCSVRGYRAPRRPSWRQRVLVPGLPEAAARELFLAKAGRQHAADPLLPAMLEAMDGVPLAIELLALQVRADERSLDRVWRAWRRKRTALLAAAEDSAHRLDSYEVSLALSLDGERMTEAGRRLYAAMGRLPAGIAVEDLDALMPEEGEDAADQLGRLGLAYDASDRLRMLAPVREHAAKQPLGEADEERLVKHWLSLGKELCARFGSAEGGEAGARLSIEWANVEAAVHLGLAGKDPAPAIDLVIPAAMNLPVGTGIVMSAMLAEAERQSLRLGDERRIAGCGLAQGFHALAHWELEAARERLQAALELFQRVGDLRGEAWCMLGLGEAAMQRSQPETARERFGAALELLQKVGDLGGEAACLLDLAEVARLCSEPETARERLQAALELFQKLGRPLPKALCSLSLGRLAFMGDEHVVAREHFEAALPVSRKLGAVQLEAECVHGLGTLALARFEPDEARARFEAALGLFRKVGNPQGEARCMLGLHGVARRRWELREARDCCEAALALFRRAGDALGEAGCVQGLAEIARIRCEHAVARERYEAALLTFRRIGSPLGEAGCMRGLGVIALERSEHAVANEHLEAALQLSQRAGDPQGEANSVWYLSRLALARSEHEAARERFEAALLMYRRLASPLGEANCVWCLGELALARSELLTAGERFTAALAIFRQIGELDGEADCLRGLGDVALAEGNPSGAEQRFTAALALYQRIPMPDSAAHAHVRLARLATGEARLAHVEAAREAWVAIDRPDLLRELEQEFGVS